MTLSIALAISCTNISSPDSALEERLQLAGVLAAEDRRAATDVELTVLTAATHAASPRVRATAVRALGRLESPEHIDDIAAAFDDADASVRRAAVFAMAQAAYRSGGAAVATRIEQLLDRTPDPDSTLRGAALAALGRLVHADSAATARVGRRLLAATEMDPSTSAGARLGSDPQVEAMRGWEALARRNPDTYRPSSAAVERLRALATSATDTDLPAAAVTSPRVRRLALATLISSSTQAARRARASEAARSETDAAPALLGAGLLAAALSDDDIEVRRLAASAIDLLGNDGADAVREILVRGAADPEPRVRYAALRSSETVLSSDELCELAGRVLSDPAAGVELLAVELLATGCGPAVSSRLLPLVRELSPTRSETRDSAADGEQRDFDSQASWHRGAQALVALARVAPSTATEHVLQAAQHPIWQVRMYAAVACRSIGSSMSSILGELALNDAHANVREVALRELAAIEISRPEQLGDAGQPTRTHESIAIATLATSDYQVLLTAAGQLEASPAGVTALPALIGALERLTAQRRQTSRDPRVALLQRIIEHGGDDIMGVLRTFASDFDPVIAGLAADALTARTGVPTAPTPSALPPMTLPSLDQLDELAESRVVLHMRTAADGDGGELGTIELRLLPWEAPTNAARFARLARAGYFNGLTFHRVVPNFVIQGGSPGANEFIGDGPYTRDEITDRAHVRGTVGISTRGRDTGDAQIFINLIDNVRLDHNYTIIAEVVDGMDVADQVLEGAVIASVTIESPE